MRRLAIVALVAPLIFVAVSCLLPWSEFNCWHEDVDINSGRIRTQTYVCFVCISERIEDTALSRAVLTDHEAGTPNWKRVNTFSLGGHHSPHYRFHGAITEIRWIEIIWETGRFTPEARQKSGQHILGMWRSSGLNSASDYRETIWGIANDNEEAHRATTPADLP
jgi:hypothetical protein